MKNFKKLASWLLALTMVAGAVPAMAEEDAAADSEQAAATTSALLFMENFEDDTKYPVGVVADNTEGTKELKGSIGYVDYILRPGSKIEIAEDENGNKTVVVSGAMTEENKATYIDFNFDKSYGGGVKNYTFDFLPVKNTVYFNNFGSLKNEANSGMEKTNNCGRTIYWNGNEGSCGSLTLSEDSTTWRTISKKVDFELTQGNKMTRTEYLGETSASSSKEFASSTIEELKKIRFDMRDKYWYSATGSANWQSGGANNYMQPFEYHFDNILVEDVAPVSENNIKVTEDFEGYSEQGYKHVLSNLNLNVSAGDKIEIAKDPVTNSKALKITKGATSGTTKAVWNSGAIENEVVKLSYDVRFENHSRHLRGFPSLSTGATFIFYKNDIYWEPSMSGATSFANYAKIGNYTGVQHVEITHNPSLEADNTSAVITKSDGTVHKDTYSKGAGKAFENVTFNTEYAAAGTTYASHMGTAEGDGVYWIDNITVEILALNLENSNIKAGDTGVPVNKDLVLTFNEPVSETIKESLFITKGTDALVYGEDYTVTLSSDAKTVTVEAISGEWDYETTYEVVIPTVEGVVDIKPYQGTIINFVTGKYTSILVDDDFSYLTLGDKWSVAADAADGSTVAIGDYIKATLKPGDSIEYAYDEVRGKNGLKLTKGNGVGDLNFKYFFPESYTDGKYRVVVDERVEHHSKAHPRWPALLDGNGAEIGYGVYGAGYWLEGTGAFNQVDRFGVNWKDVNNSRWIGGYSADNSVVGEVITETGYRIGTYAPATGVYEWSKEPATTAEALGGVLMRMKWNGSSSADYGNRYIPGSAKATDENPDNNGIAWIYSVKVEEILLQVSETSFESSQLEFDPAGVLTVTFSEKLDLSTVNANTFKLYKGSDLIDSYEYNVSLSADGKTVTLSPVAGLEYGTNYTINITKDVKAADSEIGGLREEKNYTLKTAEYVDTVNPDIVWSTIPNGSENVDYNTESIVLSTNDVLLDDTTVTKDNIKVYENGVSIDTYSVEVKENFAVKVSFEGLKKAADYKITVTGLKSGGANALEMTADYELNFTTRDDIYTENVTSKISADGEKSVVTAELFNKSAESVTYQVIGVLKDDEGKILSVHYGNSGTIEADGYTDITVEAAKNENAAYFDLYIWDGIGSMKPLVKKAELNSVNRRTYGYDNFVDSEKPVRLAFIGGSITQQGHYTTPLKKSLTTYLKAENTERDVKFVNHAVDGGVGGTGSDLGLYRLEKDVISKNPDIVFIEFAVNDTSNTYTQKTLEGMIRKLMKLDHQPVVILLNNATKGFKSLETIASWQDIISTYGIGSVNVAEYLKANVASEENPEGSYVWKTEDLANYPNATVLTSDGTHPNAEGGKIYAEFMYNTLTEKTENFFKKMNYVKDPLSGYEYNNPRMISWTEAEYDDNWENSKEMTWAFSDGVAAAKNDGATLTFTFTGTTIGVYAPKSVNGGKASYSIDNGAKTGTVSIASGTTSKMEMASVIANDLTDGEHTITISVDSLGDKYFKFGYFIVD